RARRARNALRRWLRGRSRRPAGRPARDTRRFAGRSRVQQHASRIDLAQSGQVRWAATKNTPFGTKGGGLNREARRGMSPYAESHPPHRAARVRLLAPSLALALRAGRRRSRPIESAVVAPPFVPKGEDKRQII